MIRLDRDQAVSVGVLAALLIVCLGALELSFHLRAQAAQELSERQELLARLETRIKSQRAGAARVTTVAPLAAFVNAPTQGIAGAQLQAYLMQVAADHHAAVVSSGLETARRDDPADSIRLKATLEIGLNALQAVLFRLESGTPYVFIDALAVQLPSTAAGQASDDPLLRVTVDLRATWRRAT
jgi:general secretion pathway protein M